MNPTLVLAVLTLVTKFPGFNPDTEVALNCQVFV
jgi:hypothetical protein